MGVRAHKKRLHKGGVVRDLAGGRLRWLAWFRCGLLAGVVLACLLRGAV